MEPLEAADSTLIFKYAVKQIAAKHGFVASFMAKPFDELSGNGLHLHQSLWSRNSKNLFWQDEAPHLSETGKSYVAGLLKHMRELSVFGSPTPNSYKRRVPYSFAPVNEPWGFDNRTLAIRVIALSPSATRIEQRHASADANPYLVITAQLLAGAEGVRKSMTPPQVMTTDAYSINGNCLPHSLGEALQYLEGSAFARASFGDELVDLSLELLRHELQLYETAVTDWERKRYLLSS